MITAVEMIDCPDCREPLTKLGEAAPWCGACEWNLNTFADRPSDSRFWRRVRGAERRAGFRAHRQLAASTEPLPIGGRAYTVLLTISAVLLLADLVLAAAGIGLMVAHPWFWPIVGGLVLIGLALLLRPRLGRLKPLLAHGYVVERENTPVLHRMIDHLATTLDAPRPDVVVLDFAWNAGVTRVGPRQTRVLILGVPLLLALTPQQMIALVGHELGHLKHEDNRRSLLLQPAATVFGRLAAMVKPPRDVTRMAGWQVFFVHLLPVWKLVGGTAYLLLSSAHLAINGVIAGQNRAIELRADEMSARAAGTVAALEMLDILALTPILTGYLKHHVERGAAAARWRMLMGVVREKHLDQLPSWRQLTMRTEASIFAPHPAAGRRHQWLASRPARTPLLVVDEAAGVRLEEEIAPYAEILHGEMLNHVLI
jgi:heat shock protein HtpX